MPNRAININPSPATDNSSLPMDNITFVSHSSRLYGASRSLLELVKGLKAMGARLCVVLPAEGLMAQALRRLAVEVFVIPFPCWVGSPEQAAQRNHRRYGIEMVVAKISWLLARWGTELVWSNSSVSPVGALAADQRSLPHIWHLRELNGESQGFAFDWHESEVIALFNQSQRRIAVSQLTRVHYQAMGCLPCEVLYSGIASAEELKARSAPQPIHQPTRLLLVGRVMPSKGQTIAIQAVRQLLDSGYPTRLRIVGDGDLDGCRELASQLNILDQVELVGFHDQVQQDYQWADLALTCSINEPMGRTTVEAMSYGLPVVGDFRGGTGELIDHGITGLLYDGTPTQLVTRIVALIHSQALRERLSNEARRWVQTHFSREVYLTRLLEMLRGPALDH